MCIRDSGVGRREIGHGHLAWRALKGQIPTGYPYTVRVVSDIMESNGSCLLYTSNNPLAVLASNIHVLKIVHLL